MAALETRIFLPTGFLETDKAQQLVQWLIDDIGWFSPSKYGRSMPDIKLDNDADVMEELMAFYDNAQRLSVEGTPKPSGFMLLPDRRGQATSIGKLIWTMPSSWADDEDWQKAHVEHICEAMHMLRSPLAFCALDKDIDRKLKHEVPGPIGTKVEPTVRGYGEGLPGVFWRNFYGPDYVALFGERLEALPEGTARALDGGLWLVAPYAEPAEAFTPAGAAAERDVIETLGVECFYDFETDTPPQRFPKT
ncbi:hypothetical protein [Halomonas cerina]|uniref:Uncharacterized protein n=1 Tax=Halomonas cerina TaxID=447424 RepID=A0A839VD32_9GAMM|nr:hypothetical protein [Halomonas cerina]MBB3191860.1 hypothetical protein [Halomonas cerina]